MWWQIKKHTLAGFCGFVGAKNGFNLIQKTEQLNHF
jgi:hypothetical protein